MTKNNIIAVFTSKNTEKQLNLLKKNQNFIHAIEVRVDTFYKNDFSIETISHIIKKIQDFLPKTKIIITFRQFNEGGYIKVSDNTRFYVISKILEESFKNIDYIDIEFYSKIRNKVINLAKKYNKSLILSYHKLKRTNDNEKILKIIKQIVKFAKNSVKCKNFIKIVIKCDKYDYFLEILKNVYKTSKKIDIFKKMTIFSIGKTSLLTRLTSIILDMPLVYGAISTAVIQTQPNIDKLISIKKDLGFIYNK